MEKKKKILKKIKKEKILKNRKNFSVKSEAQKKRVLVKKIGALKKSEKKEQGKKKLKPQKQNKKTIKKPVFKKSVKKTALKPQKEKQKILPSKIHTAKKTAQKIEKTVKTEEGKFPAEAFFKARIKVVGIGGGGGSIVSEIGRSLEKASFMIADTDLRALKKKAGIKYCWFGGDLTRGLGTGVNIDLAKQAAEAAKEKISENFKDQDIIIFIASLGGGLGSGATQIFVEEAKKYGAITFGIFTLPFKFEGKNKSKIAQNALKNLRQSLNVSLTIPNEKIFKIIDESTPITSAFSTVNKNLIGSLESLIDLIYSPGIINIDFADLRTILRGRGNVAFLNTIEESGKNRAEKICEKVLFNPLLQNSGFNAEKILFNISGSENLSMFEVEKVSSHISKLNPEAKIIFGISKNAKLKNKIKTTILMTGGGGKEEVKKNTEPVLEKKPEKIVKKDEKNSEKAKIKEVTKKPIKKPAKQSKTHPAPVFEKQKAQPVSALTVVASVSKKTTLNEEKNEGSLEEAKKNTIRRSGLEVKKAEEEEEQRKIDQEKEWEIPAFLRRVKFKS